MKQFAKSFYFSQAWKQCRRQVFKQRHGLCERCLALGLYAPGEIVHHKTPLTPDNIHDENITLNPDNLELLCRECHEKAHGAKNFRYSVRPDGTITAKY